MLVPCCASATPLRVQRPRVACRGGQRGGEEAPISPSRKQGGRPATFTEDQAGRARLAALSAGLSAGVAHLSSTAIGAAALLPVAVGAALGVLVAHSIEHDPPPGLCVVITGGTKGIGKALAREFLWRGDRVLITGRHSASALEAVTSLRQQTGCPPDAITAAVADCSDPRAMSAMVDALGTAGHVDMFICNAGCSGAYKAFEDADACVLDEVISSTLGCSVLCAHAALRTFSEQRRRGDARGTLWLTDGAGSGGDATPMYAAYGSAKAGVRQFARSLQAEGPPSAAVGLLSPGMVLTELLLQGATPRNKAAFNALAEQPETCAAQLVPALRRAHGRAMAEPQSRLPHLRVLTIPRAAMRLAMLPMLRNRYFSADGRPTYPPEEERIAALAAQRKRERVVGAARRGGSGAASTGAQVAVLALAVLASLALSCLPLP